MELGVRCQIDTANKTSAIAKGDLNIISWPELVKPAKWGKKVPVLWYGELIVGKVVQESVKEDVEQELLAECAQQ